jgi:hypothetical protein
MNLAIEKLVAVVIFLIILLVLVIFTGIPEALGRQVGLQGELRDCCQAYVARGCPSFSNPETDLNIYCNNKNLGKMVSDFNMDYDSLRTFCNCP